MTESNNPLDHIDNIGELSFKTYVRLDYHFKSDKALLKVFDKYGHFCQISVNYLLKTEHDFGLKHHEEKEIEFI